MICPLCKTEYREGFYTCADCSVSLVPGIAEVESDLKSASHEIEYYGGDFVEVFRTYDLSEILAIKLAFDEENIPSNFSDGFVLDAYPYKLARFFVPFDYKVKALEIIKAITVAP